nr:polysaccharide biosynthesis protein [uncultured Methanoregula sp.]
MNNKSFYKNKRILVTGGAGSIGRELVRKILDYDPFIVRVLDNNETGLFDLENELGSNKIRPLIGDIRDKDRLLMAFDGIDIVFHASALKHVPLCESNPFDAVKTNVIGTQNVLDAALSKEVEKVINVSTDKAVNPTNVMGATKLLAERLTISANYYRGNKRTVFSSVRFGNVLNSRGSVIPLFLNQIQKGGPLTITDKKMTRFFMDIPSAVNLIINAGRISQGREIFILKMSAMGISDLAQAMIEEFAPKYGFKPEDIGMQVIGKRGGEKLYEELMTKEEAASAYENDEMFLILPQKITHEEPFAVQVEKSFKKSKIEEFSSRNSKLLTIGEIHALFRQLHDNSNSKS